MQGMPRTSLSAAFEWDDVKIFLAIARGGSITAAAKSVGVDASTVSRRVAALERNLGVSLFTRGRSGVALTEEGQGILAIAERAEESMLAIARSRGAFSTAPGGTVRLATSGILSAYLLAPHVTLFHRRHPGVRLEIAVARQLVGLAKREADVSLRLRPEGKPIAEPSAVAIPLGPVAFALFGTRRETRARAPRFIRHFGFEPGRKHLEARSAGADSMLWVDELPTAFMLARAGYGLAVLPCFMGDRERSLVRASDVLERHRLFAVTLRELRGLPRIDAVVRWLKDVVDREPTLRG